MEHPVRVVEPLNQIPCGDHPRDRIHPKEHGADTQIPFVASILKRVQPDQGSTGDDPEEAMGEYFENVRQRCGCHAAGPPDEVARRGEPA